MDTQTTLTIRPATADDYPALARLLAEGFKGKFAIALGKDEVIRARRIEMLLPYKVVCPGYIYVLYDGETLAASFTLKTVETSPTATDYRQSRAALQATDGWWRAWWATIIFRLLGGDALKPNESYLDNLVTARAMQRRGAGTQAAAHAYTESHALGKTFIVADVMSSNYRVVGLYKKEGWDVVGRNYWVAPITWPLLGTPGILRIRKELTNSADE
ncbi:MAG: GNAT family N-acetyltransferase [Anaerolineae bacterium]|nr:GNAT family N-acetyltransferase [Anaerolineae bacterium]